MAIISELKTKRTVLSNELERLTKLTVNATNNRKANDLLNEIERLDQKIELEVKNQRFSSNHFSGSRADQNDLKKFSFGKFLREAATGTLTGLEYECHLEGKEEIKRICFDGAKGFCIPSRVLKSVSFRDNTGQNISTDIDGGYMVQKTHFEYFDALRNALVLPGLGANFLTDLIGIVPLIQGSQWTSQYLDEGQQISLSKASLSTVNMKAKRLAGLAVITKQLLVQTANQYEDYLVKGLINANSQAIQNAAINGLAVNNEPVGILNNSAINIIPGGINGNIPSFQNMLDLEYSLASVNADIGSMGYLTNTKMRSKLKSLLKVIGVSGFIWEGNYINGFKATATNTVPSNLTKGTSIGVCNPIIFGDFSKMVIGNWGGLDIIVDPYTLNESGQIRVIVNSFNDIQLVNPASFAVMPDALLS